MTTLVSLWGTTAGLIGICLAMPKHFSQVWQRKPSSSERAALRVFGWLGLIGSVLQCAATRGIGLGLVFACAALTLVGLALALLLTYRPRLVPALGLATVCAAVGASVWLAL